MSKPPPPFAFTGRENPTLLLFGTCINFEIFKKISQRQIVALYLVAIYISLHHVGQQQQSSCGHYDPGWSSGAVWVRLSQAWSRWLTSLILPAFDQTHAHTLPSLQTLVSTLSSPSTSSGDPSEEVERQLTTLRQSLVRMEQCVEEMMSMLYNVDLFMDRPQEKTAGGKDPKTALEHISELFHVS